MFADPAGADACVLDQMTVTNVSDQEALDDFLNSTSDTSAGTSLTSGNFCCSYLKSTQLLCMFFMLPGSLEFVEIV